MSARKGNIATTVYTFQCVLYSVTKSRPQSLSLSLCSLCGPSLPAWLTIAAARTHTHTQGRHLQRETGAERQTDINMARAAWQTGGGTRSWVTPLTATATATAVALFLFVIVAVVVVVISRRWLTICKEISFSISIWHWGVGFVLAKAKSDGRLTSNKTQMAKQMEIKTKIVQTLPASLHASLNLQSHELLSCLSPSLSHSPPHSLSLFHCLLGHKSMLAAFL